jgi:hypothetical protein
MKLKKTAVIILIFLFCLAPQIAYASGIETDGAFEDWADKPGQADSSAGAIPTEDIVMFKWYPDTNSGNLYLYLEREWGFTDYDPKNPQAVDWDFTMSIDCDDGVKTAYVHYHPESTQVDVVLRDENDSFLWRGKGKWGEGKDSARRLEFFLPVSYLAGGLPGGYQFDIRIESGDDKTPDTGSITISTISTYPVLSAVILALAAAAGFLYFSRRKGQL